MADVLKIDGKRPGRPPKSARKPLSAEWSLGTVSGELRVDSLSPFAFYLRALDGRKELIRADVRADLGNLSVQDMLGDPLLREQMLKLLEVLRQAVAAPVLPTAAEAVHGTSAAQSEIAERGRRAQEAAERAAQAKAEELGVADLRAKLDACGKAASEAWNAVYSSPAESAGEDG